MSLTSRLIEPTDCSCARRRPVPQKNVSATKTFKTATERDRNENSGVALKTESRLITHGNTIEHVAGKCCGPVSVGAFFDTAKKRRTEIARGDRPGETPVTVDVGG